MLPRTKSVSFLAPVEGLDREGTLQWEQRPSLFELREHKGDPLAVNYQVEWGLDQEGPE